MRRVIELAPKPATTMVARFVAKRTENKAIAAEAAPRVSKVAGFLDYIGLGGISLTVLLQQLGAFVVDWRTLAVLGAGGSAWVVVQYLKYRARKAYGVPSIPAADGAS
jgi:hypothetical protein